MVIPDPGEVVGWRWASPAVALGDPEVEMVHATRRILESVAGEPDVARLISKLRRRVEPEPVRPAIVRAGSGWEIVEPALQRQRSRKPS